MLRALTTRTLSARLTTPLLSRSYFAALYAHTKPIKAKIAEGYRGETLKYFIEDDQWYDALVITKSPNGGKDIGRAYGVNTDSRAYHTFYLLAPDFNTELLYAIPQDVWNAFIAALPNQRIVNLLNLATYRHLYSGYNVAMGGYTEILQLRRAKHIARFHFLISMDSNTNGRMSLTTLCDRLAKGEDITKLLAESFGLPMLTAEFFDKFAHHDDWNEVARIGELIKRRSLKPDGVTFDSDKANEFIAALPSSQQSPLEFHAMLKNYSQLADSISQSVFAHFDRKIWDQFEANVFYHQPFTTADITFDFNLLRDYLDTAIANLIYPEIMRRVLTAYPGASDQLLSELMERSHSKAYYAMRGPFFALCADKTKLAALVSQGKQFRENYSVIEAKKPEKAKPKQKEDTWHALFEQQIIDGVTFTCITSRQADDDDYKTREKKIYHHRSDYWGGKDHIIQLQSTSGARSRVELQVLTDYDGQSFVDVVRHAAQGIIKPSSELEAAVAQLVKKIERSEITLNSKRGKIVTPRMETTLEQIYAIYPYQLTDENAQEQIYQAYKSAGVLPAFMVADSYRDMLSKAPELLALMNDIIVSLGCVPITIAADTNPSRPDKCLI